MTASRLLPGLLALLLPLCAGASDAVLPADYAAAKQRANQDEAALPAALAGRVHQAQARALDEGVARCATPQPDTSAFTIVVALDADGAVLRSWRAGDTPLAICMEKFLRDQRLPAPDTAPLLLAYELSFTP